MRRPLIGLVVLLVFVAHFVAGQEPPARATIQGLVLSDSSGNPISGAEVILATYITYGSMPQEPGSTRPLVSVPGVPNVRTGADGSFSFTNVNPGAYRVFATSNGYVRQELEQKTPYGSGRPFIVAAGETLKDLTLRLSSTGAINGRILDDAGQPAMNVPVHLLRVGYTQLGRRLESVANTTSNDRGDYRLYGVAPGRYYLVAGTTPESMAPLAAVGNPNQPPTQNYSLSYYPGVADPKQAAAVEVTSGGDIALDLRVMKERTFRIRGRIVDAGTGKAPENVELGLSRETFSGTSSVVYPGRLYDAATGNFELQNVLPGTYALQVRNPAALVGISPQARATVAVPAAFMAITVTTTDVEGLALILMNPVSVPARLIVEGTILTDLTNFSLRVVLTSLTKGPDNSRQQPTLKPDGTFTLTNVHEGEYHVWIPNLAPGFYVKSLRYAGLNVLTNPMRVSATSSGTLEITLRGGAPRVTGTVTDSRGQSVGGIQLAVIPDQRNWFDAYRLGVANPDGRFTIANVPPGSYKVFAWEAVEERGYFDPDFVARHEQQGHAITVNEGANLEINARLIPARP